MDNQAYIVDRMINDDFAAAARSREKAKAAGAEPAEYHSFAADLHLHRGKPELAIQPAEAGWVADPKATIHVINLAHALLFSGRREEERALCTEVLSLPAEQGLNGGEFILHDYQMFATRGEKPYPEIAGVHALGEGVSGGEEVRERHGARSAGREVKGRSHAPTSAATVVRRGGTRSGERGTDAGRGAQ